MTAILAIDPGKTNMGVWCGKILEVDGKLIPETLYIDKLDIGDATLYKGTVATLKTLVEEVEERTKGSTLESVVETQDPRNVPARVVACTAYGYLFGKDIYCEFSSSKLKNEAMDVLSKQYHVSMVAKPTKEEMPDSKARKRIMHNINKKNSRALVLKMMQDLEEYKIANKLQDARDPQGHKKADDMTDALLLGIGMWIKRTQYLKNKKKKK